MPAKVVILGGGVAGLSAAHELSERGFAVEVYERRNIPGGKARSLEVGEPTRGRRPLAGEHGFRFFPGFYKHVVDTMRRIPVGSRTVADNLVDTTGIQIAGYEKPSVYLPARFPEAPEELRSAFNFVLALLGQELGLNFAELGYLGTKVWQFITSCDERRLTEYEAVSWWDFIEAEHRSAAYKMVFGHGITRSLVAAKARRASTRTIGNIFVQMMLYILQPGTAADRVLNGPTNEVWIEPWLAHLRKRGVAYHLDAEVKGLDLRQGRIVAAIVARRGQLERIEGDHFVAAMPVERMAELVTPALAAADPALAVLPELSGNVEWMNGIQFYLTEDVPLVHGHTIFLSSPWALTSVSQAQFWRGYDMSAHGDGRVKGILSVDISNWTVPGLRGKTADQCTREEIKQEVWDQIKLSVNVGGKTILTDRHLHSWFLDPDILDSDPTTPGMETNLEPLLVNYTDTWSLRPEAVTRIPNFFLASDYVRTHTDLATMEAANEAARRATNGILAASGSKAAPCGVWPLQEPDLLIPLKALDRQRFRRKLPWDGGAVSAAQQALGLATLIPPDAHHPDPLSAETQRRDPLAARLATG
jgi:uncharacterized protein with NAD-binding domain and iron-sulfur cluster